MDTKSDKDYYMNLQLLKDAIGREHSIAVASPDEDPDRKMWQVMPDDLEDYDFFDWYCEKFPNDQFFDSIHEAVARYLFWRNRWIEQGLPEPNYKKNG